MTDLPALSYVVSIEGQNITVPAEIGASDDNVRKALAPYYPDVANAMITRVEKDAVVTITVVKRAGTKGLDSPLASLLTCPGGRNPVVDLYEQMVQVPPSALEPEEFLALEARIEQVVEEGDAQAEAVDNALRRIQAANPQPAPVIPLGF